MSSSTNNLSPSLSIEKNEAGFSAVGGDKNKTMSKSVESALDNDHYPKGLKLGMIIVALMLSMFLVRHSSFQLVVVLAYATTFLSRAAL